MLLDECFLFCDPPARPLSVLQHAHDHEQSPCLRVASTVSFAVVSVSPTGGFGLLLRYAHASVGTRPRVRGEYNLLPITLSTKTGQNQQRTSTFQWHDGQT